jgi:hypothetical protein
VARALALLGYDDDAVGWLRLALNGGISEAALRDDPDLAPLLDRLRPISPQESRPDRP